MTGRMFKKLRAYVARREDFWFRLRVLSDAEFEARYHRPGLPWELDEFFPYFVRERQARIDREVAESVAKLAERVELLRKDSERMERRIKFLREKALEGGNNAR